MEFSHFFTEKFGFGSRGLEIAHKMEIKNWLGNVSWAGNIGFTPLPLRDLRLKLQSNQVTRTPQDYIDCIDYTL